jgi:hypothetical protein
MTQNVLTLCLVIAAPAVLRQFLELCPGVPWEKAIGLMQALQDVGFEMPQSEAADDPPDAEDAAEFTQALGRNGDDTALAYFARDRLGLVAATSLTWMIGRNLSGSETEMAVKNNLTDFSGTLGPVHAVLDQSALWVGEDGVGAADEMAVSACWSREVTPAVGAVTHVRDYLAARQLLNGAISFSVVIEAAPNKKWNFIGSLLA